MKLPDAIALSANDTAKLAVSDPADPVHRGTNEEFGILYMWTMGHTTPVTQFGYLDELPAADKQMLCVCGERHGFPDDFELHLRLINEDRWEPIFPTSPLQALAKCADDEGIDDS